MKKLVLAAALLAIAVLAYVLVNTKSGFAGNTSSISLSTTVDTPTYREYAFNSGSDRDLGFTKRAFAQLPSSTTLLSANSAAMPAQEMTFVRLTPEEQQTGILERRTWGDDVYELTKESGDMLAGTYRVLVNGNLLFKADMSYGADGPIQDWRVVDGKPAFTFLTPCADAEQTSCTDIWYDGERISEAYSVTNPRYLFSFENHIGFVATNEGADAIYFDGAIVTPGFDVIWTHNCCSLTEILPTVYENGTLLFYAERGGTTNLVEVILE